MRNLSRNITTTFDVKDIEEKIWYNELKRIEASVWSISNTKRLLAWCQSTKKKHEERITRQLSVVEHTFQYTNKRFLADAEMTLEKTNWAQQFRLLFPRLWSMTAAGFSIHTDTAMPENRNVRDFASITKIMMIHIIIEQDIHYEAAVFFRVSFRWHALVRFSFRSLCLIFCHRTFFVLLSFSSHFGYAKARTHK